MDSLDLLAIAAELAAVDPTYEDVASKFWKHFVYIARAMNHLDSDGLSLWDEEEGFLFDVLHTPQGERIPMRVRSMVGLIPLYAAQTLEPDQLKAMPAFKRRLEWFIAHRPDMTENMACMRSKGSGERRLLSITTRTQLERILKIMLDEEEFLSEYGIRALSRRHRERPYTLTLEGKEHSVQYEPAESSMGLFGGNSNWRDPIWLPVNYLLIQALRRLHEYYGPDLAVECPTGSGQFVNPEGTANEISQHLISIFRRDEFGHRPVFGSTQYFQTDANWSDLLPFHEYFHGDSGRGVGVSHQTGWTALVACLIFDLVDSRNASESGEVVAVEVEA